MCETCRPVSLGSKFIVQENGNGFDVPLLSIPQRSWERLKLDNSPTIRLKTSKSDGKVGIGKTSTLGNGNGGDPIQNRTQSCHVPFAVSLDRLTDRLTDISVKGVSIWAKVLA